MSYEKLIAEAQEYLLPDKMALVEKAYVFAAKAHQGQTRKSGEPLNDGSISPMRGMDKNGPTADLRSVLKAESNKEAIMTVLNQKFSATLMQSPESREKLATLTDTFFRNGGQHIQYNIVDAQELREAKKHPEKYRDLIVRVGSVSSYFVFLTPEVQDDIIARTEQGL